MLQFRFHLEQGKESWPAIIGERGQDIDVAVGPEVITYCRTEKVEFGNPPASAEGLNGLLVDDQAGGHEH